MSENKFFYTVDPKDQEAPPSLHIRRVLLACFGCIVLVVLGYAIFLVFTTWPIDEYSIAKAGTFGDSFGALNSLFTGLGFAGLLTTIFLQREDIKLTRAELSETRAEIKLQSRTFQQQQFEESFYRLLALYRENLAHLSIRSLDADGERLYGIDALSSRMQIFEETCIRQRLLPFPTDGSDMDKDDYTYWLYKNCNHYLTRQTRYVETLNMLLLMVEKDCYALDQKESYLGIIASQLTIYEVKYLFYQAFLNPNYHLIRSTVSSSPSFRERFSISSIPRGHYDAFEHLWNVRLSQRSPHDDRLFAQPSFKAARSRAAQIRQKKQIGKS